MSSIYDLNVTRADGSELSLKEFEGKVILVVNTATGCGFTPQYAPIEEMYKKYHEKGLEIIDVPCNQFAGQAPGSDEEIHEFCTLKYDTTFPHINKSDVNGENEIPFSKYLKSKKGFESFGKGPKALMMKAVAKMKDRKYKENPDIKWNFTKFVVDRNGEVVARFEPTIDMKEVEKCVVSLLG